MIVTLNPKLPESVSQQSVCRDAVNTRSLIITGSNSFFLLIISEINKPALCDVSLLSLLVTL